VLQAKGKISLNLEQKIVDDILRICYKYESINKVILFGSRARGDNYLWEAL